MENKTKVIFSLVNISLFLTNNGGLGVYISCLQMVLNEVKDAKTRGGTSC